MAISNGHIQWPYPIGTCVKFCVKYFFMFLERPPYCLTLVTLPIAATEHGHGKHLHDSKTTPAAIKKLKNGPYLSFSTRKTPNDPRGVNTPNTHHLRFQVGLPNHPPPQQLPTAKVDLRHVAGHRAVPVVHRVEAVPWALHSGQGGRPDGIGRLHQVQGRMVGHLKKRMTGTRERPPKIAKDRKLARMSPFVGIEIIGHPEFCTTF